MTLLEKLRARLVELAAALAAIPQAAEADDRELTDDESRTVTEHVAEFERIEPQVRTLEAAAAAAARLDAPAPRQTSALVPGATGLAHAPPPAAPGGGQITGGAPVVEGHENRGFETFGEFAQSVHLAAQQPASIDPRLVPEAALPSGVSESRGEDGAYLIPPAYGQEIFTLSLQEDSFLALTDDYPLTGTNSMTWPRDLATPWGTPGVKTYWQGEGTPGVPTRPRFRDFTQRLKKLIGLVRATDEVLSDARVLGRYLTRRLSEAVRWESNEALMNGNGVTRPLGFAHANQGSMITVAKETSQAADTIVAANVVKMLGRLLPGSLARAIWMINQDAYHTLPLLTIGNQPVFVAASAGLQNPVAGVLLGRPILITQTCQTLGDAGDLVIADWGAYVTITREGGASIAQSMHLYFDSDEHAFRVTFRLDGQPWLDEQVVPARGSNNLGPIVRLANRA